MTEYQCSALIDGERYEFVTCGCSTMTQAFNAFEQYLFAEHSRHIELADGLHVEKVEIE